MVWPALTTLGLLSHSNDTSRFPEEDLPVQQQQQQQQQGRATGQ